MTRKEMQIKVNREVMSNWMKAEKVWDSVPDCATVTRIDCCKCGFIIWRGYIFLVSHSKMIAYIDPYGVLVDILRLLYVFTATSAKDVSKFRKMFKHCDEITYREVRK